MTKSPLAVGDRGLSALIRGAARRDKIVQPFTGSAAAAINKSCPGPTMSFGFGGRLIARSAYGEKIGVEFSQRCPLRRA
jgi:hypothetical protein